MNTDDAIMAGDEIEIIVDSDDSSDDVEFISHVVAVSDDDDDVVMVNVNPADTSEEQRRPSPTPPFRTTVSEACRSGLLNCAPRQETASNDEADVTMVDGASGDQRAALPTPPSRTTVSEACHSGQLWCTPDGAVEDHRRVLPTPPSRTTIPGERREPLTHDDNDEVSLILSSDEEEQSRRVLAPPPSTTTTRATPLLDNQRDLWFVTTTPKPGNGPEGLPHGLNALGGLMCVWAIGKEGGSREKRSFRVKPSPWNSTFEGAAEVAVFFDLFTAKLSEALSAFQLTGRIPSVEWRCSVLDRADGKLRRKLRPAIPQGKGSLDGLWRLVEEEKAVKKLSPKDSLLGKSREDYFGF